MSATEIREALTGVRDATDVPAVDRLAFERRVRAERRRRTTARVLVAGAVAASVAVVAAVAGGIGAGNQGRDGAPAAGPHGVGLDETVFFVRDGQVTALDPSGEMHDLGLRAEGVVGFTSERVYVVDDNRRLVVRTVSYDDQRRLILGHAPSPVPGVVRSAALSGDGRYLAWTDRDAVTHRFDLKAGRQDLDIPGDDVSVVIGVGADGLLMSEGAGELVLRDADSAVSIPVHGSGAGSQLAMGHVLVNNRDGRAELYDVAGGTAELVDTMNGFGTIAPDAERIAVLAPAGPPELRIWMGGRSLLVTDLDAEPDQVRWVDETRLLVAAHGAAASELWGCDVDLGCRQLPVDGEISLNR